MKLLMTALLMTSLSAFAGPLTFEEAIHASNYELSGNALSETQQVDIINALYAEITGENVFKCNVRNGQEKLAAVLKAYTPTNGSIKVAGTKSKPVIILSTKNVYNYKYSLNFMTTRDLKRVTSLTSEEGTAVMVDVNSGTLLAPSLKKVETVINPTKITCKRKK